jgi:stage II sporulation protein M
MLPKPQKIHYQVIIGFFVVALAFGYVTGIESRVTDKNIINDIFSPYSFLKNLSSLSLFFFIFFNNAFKALLTIFLGIFFGIYPLYFIFVNGELIGLVYALSAGNIGAAGALAGLLPHGIFELTAILIAGGYGFWLGTRTFRSIVYHESLRPAIGAAFRAYYRTILPLLLVAAVIEAYLTPILIQTFRQK